MIAAISARKNTEQNGSRDEIRPEIREYLVAKPAENLWSWIIDRHGPNEEFFLARKRRMGA